MAASPRDLLKPRTQRLEEVATGLQKQAGFHDSQFVTFGCVLAPGATPANLAISAGEYALGQALIELPAVTAQVLSGLTPALVTMAAGQSCYVLVEADATQPTPVLTFTQSAIVSAGTPVMPSPNAGRIVLGYLAPTGVFVFGTTALTAPFCVTQPYSAGNVNPSGTQSTTGSSGGF
jgi:hypothetical protein